MTDSSEFTKLEWLDFRLAASSKKCSMPGALLRRLINAYEKHQSDSVLKDDTIADRDQTIATLRAELEWAHDAIKGVIRVADRNTVEFDAARAVINSAITTTQG